MKISSRNRLQSITGFGKGWMRLLVAVLVSVFLFAAAAAADPTSAGWYVSGKSTFYYVSGEKGLAKAVGMKQVDGSWFYFNADGVLQTGWVQTADGYRYFSTEGAVGTIGKMLTGLQKIGENIYFFDENGVMRTGFVQTTCGSYFFRRTGAVGVIGSAYIGKWVTADGARRYFGKNGKMAVSTWINSYYVGSDGAKLKSAITPDGYVLGKNGKKAGRVSASGWIKKGGKYYYYNKKTGKLFTSRFKTIDGKTYYFNADGVRVKGWQTIGNYRYYFDSKGVRQTGKVTIKGKDYYFNKIGRLQIEKTVDGYTTDENGEIIAKERTGGKAKVLIVAGHGQGDVGAASSLGQEYLYTRAFAKLIYTKLLDDGKVSVEYYMDGSTGYDLYQRNKAVLGSLTSKITGKGSVKSKVIKALKASTAVPALWEYDYVLEVHFNATATASKDEKGDGKAKGFGIYVNSYKSAKHKEIDTKIVSAMRKVGSVVWGGGVLGSSGLLNARVLNELGVNYSLIETAFIDDKDDMKFYNSKKKEMAEAVAASIESFLG